jgi:hypothetical protein
VVTLKGKFSESDVLKAFDLTDDRRRPPNIMSVSVQDCSLVGTCLLLIGFDHIGCQGRRLLQSTASLVPRHVILTSWQPAGRKATGRCMHCRQRRERFPAFPAFPTESLVAL